MTPPMNVKINTYHETVSNMHSVYIEQAESSTKMQLTKFVTS